MRDPDVVAKYQHDEAEWAPYAAPLAVVRPRTALEVQAVVRACLDHDTAVVTRGAGTGLSGGANATDGCVVLALEGMNAIKEIDPLERYAVVEPGVVNDHLRAACAEHGLWYPPDPASSPWSTIGGNVATNAGGLCCVKYGVTRDYVLGMQIVTGTGDLVRLGRKTAKGVAGYDLAGLMVGSEGTLGVITEITVKSATAPGPAAHGGRLLRLHRRRGPGRQRGGRGGAHPVGARTGGQAVPHRRRRVEENGTVGGGERRSARPHRHRGSRRRPGSGEDAVVLRGSRSHVVCRLHRPGGSRRVVRCASSGLPRDGAARTGPHRRRVRAETGCPRDACAHRTDRYRPRTTIANIAHAGDGNLHPLLITPRDDEAARARAQAAFADIIDAALELGGTVTGEHGVGLLKMDGLAQELDPVVLDMHRSVKNALDPRGIMNPGKIFE